MKMYDVDEAFEILKEYKVTTHKESVRRWLREGKIKAERPASRKTGWRIEEKHLFEFIQERVHVDLVEFNTTSVVKSEEEIRAEMWWQVARKNLFEGFVEIKRSYIRECFQHLGMSKEFEEFVWEEVSRRKQGYANARAYYLLDAFVFDNKRILMDENYELLEDKVLYALIEYIRLERIKKG